RDFQFRDIVVLGWDELAEVVHHVLVFAIAHPVPDFFARGSISTNLNLRLSLLKSSGIANLVCSIGNHGPDIVATHRVHGNKHDLGLLKRRSIDRYGSMHFETRVSAPGEQEG